MPNIELFEAFVWAVGEGGDILFSLKSYSITDEPVLHFVGFTKITISDLFNRSYWNKTWALSLLDTYDGARISFDPRHNNANLVHSRRKGEL